MTAELLEALKKEVVSLKKAATLLSISYQKCQKIGIKAKYSTAELEIFEAFTARFSRLSDLLMQKIFRLIDTIEMVYDGTMIDRINRAEKRELVASAKQCAKVRHLRNTIAHEYETDEYTRIFKDVLALTPPLLESVSRTVQYCKKLQKLSLL